MSLWWVIAPYLVVAFVISFVLGRRPVKTDDNEFFMVVGWPLIAAVLIVVGPFFFAHWLGNKSRRWR